MAEVQTEVESDSGGTTLRFLYLYNLTSYDRPSATDPPKVPVIEKVLLFPQPVGVSLRLYGSFGIGTG